MNERRDDLFDALGAPEVTPDLTPQIMRRLGYVEGDSRPERHRRWLTRTASVVVALMLVGIGLQIHAHSEHARRPAHGVLAPESDQKRLNEMISPIRDITAPFRRLQHDDDQTAPRQETPEATYPDIPVDPMPYRMA